MNNLQLEILIIAVFAAVSCALPGSLLVARGAALMSDAISHAVLLGIALMFLIVQKLNSGWLLCGAILSGVALISLVEMVVDGKKLKNDAALGISFPLFFSLGVIIISCYARNVHLDIDMVLLGELAFAPFNRLIINNVDCGPYAVWTLGASIIITTITILAWYKEWQIIIFDPQLALVHGLSPHRMHTALMIITSFCAVATFNIIGSLMVIALMVIPPATAYLFAKRFSHFILLSFGFGVSSSCLGYAIAIILNSSIAGCVAMAAGVLYIISLFYVQNFDH